MRLLNGAIVEATAKGLKEVESIDLAWCLGAVVKFNGASPANYSYAQSSVNLAQLLKKKGFNQDTIKWALLSPAWVLFLGTISDNAVRINPELEKTIDETQKLVSDRFGMGAFEPETYALEIAHALFDAEQANFFGLPDLVEGTTEEILKETNFKFGPVLSTPDAMALWLQYWNGLEDQVGGGHG
ncbi:hypothetical protein [uncultured Kiloniella sp.]|uniref:hypothetical protein n=1 Tax=uncultured Kiloniella sp. TaxID=1133091 RepID=UPI002614E93A|nr:hypothetical protein [uncultured Kiloniella sp.]